MPKGSSGKLGRSRELYEGGGGKALEPTEAWGAAAGRGKGKSIQTDKQTVSAYDSNYM